MLLIPAIDLREGRCVRLHQGCFEATTHYPDSALETLRRYRAAGATWLHVVDLDGAKDGIRANAPLIESLIQEGGVRLQVGGGVRDEDSIQALLELGAARVVIGSAATERPEVVACWLARYGSERVCLAFDVRDAAKGPEVHTRGWQKGSQIVLWDAVSQYPSGLLRHVLCTDIARDGTLQGPNLDLYRSALARFPRLRWQASGGVRDADDLLALRALGLTAAISGKALLDQRISVEELRPFLRDASFPVSTSATARS